MEPLSRDETGAEQLAFLSGMLNRAFESHLGFAAHGELLPVDPPIRGAVRVFMCTVSS